MKKYIIALCCFLMLLFGSQAYAVIIDFNDGGVGIHYYYYDETFNTTFHFINLNDMYRAEYQNSTYLNADWGDDIGNCAVFNDWGKTVVVEASKSFNFDGAFFALFTVNNQSIDPNEYKKMYTAQSIIVNGYSGGNLVGTFEMALDNGFEWLEAERILVDKLVFTYTFAGDPEYDMGFWLMDKFTFNNPDGPNNETPIPEPATLILFGAGLLGLGLARKKLS